MNLALILPYLAAAAGTLALLLYRSIYSRVVTLEANTYQKADAVQNRADIVADLEDHSQRDEEQFRAVQATLKDMKAEFHENFVTLRAENNEKRTEMRNDVMNLRSESNAANARIYDLIERQKTAGRKR